jgi:hypothetical protein
MTNSFAQTSSPGSRPETEQVPEAVIGQTFNAANMPMKFKTGLCNIQANLCIGAPADPLENEAGAMAYTIRRKPEQNFIQREYNQCEEEEKLQLVRLMNIKCRYKEN